MYGAIACDKWGVCVCVQPVYSAIACDKWGSRVFDSLWDAATFDQRQMIATSLVLRAAALRSSQFGSFIYDRCGLRCFSDRRHEWKQLQMSETSKRHLLRQMIDADDSAAHKPRTCVCCFVSAVDVLIVFSTRHC